MLFSLYLAFRITPEKFKLLNLDHQGAGTHPLTTMGCSYLPDQVMWPCRSSGMKYIQESCNETLGWQRAIIGFFLALSNFQSSNLIGFLLTRPIYIVWHQMPIVILLFTANSDFNLLSDIEKLLLQQEKQGFCCPLMWFLHDESLLHWNSRRPTTVLFNVSG